MALTPILEEMEPAQHEAEVGKQRDDDPKLPLPGAPEGSKAEYRQVLCVSVWTPGPSTQPGAAS